MSKNGPLALCFNALVIAFMLAPLLIVCIVAFTPENTLTIPTTHLSLRWFKAVFAHPDFVQSFWNSLWLALSSASLATLIAVPAGLAITRYEFAGRDALNALFLSPLIVPHLVLGVAMLRLFSLIGATGSFFWLVLAHVVIVTPYVLRLVVAAAFYLLYPVGLVVFGVAYGGVGSDWKNAALYGGLFGLFAYATYDLTNLATLRNWPASLAAIDIAWGAFVSAASAIAGRLVLDRMAAS